MQSDLSCCVSSDVQRALNLAGIQHYGCVSVQDIQFSEEFRAACEMNRCGKYGTNWTCPPAVGAFAQGVERIRAFSRGLVLQTIWILTDSFDIEGMLASGETHNQRVRDAYQQVGSLLSKGPTKLFSAGACSVCARCTYLDGQPCAFPEQAVAPLEGYGIDVTHVIQLAGLRYNNGPNTVSYVGMILF